MKPKVCHLVGGNGMGWTGGIKATLKSLEMSHLSEKFDFVVATLADASSVVKQQRPDVIVVHAASSWRGFLSLWNLRHSSKLIVNEHHYSANFEAFNVPSAARFRWMLKLTYGMCDRVIAVSAGQQQWMLKNKLVAAHKIALIPSSRIVDEFLAVPPQTRHADADRPFVLGAYGRLCFQKGFDVLIEAVKQLPESQIKIKLQLGGTGVEETKLKELAAGCSQIEFVGRIDDVPAFLSQCDAVVIPSRWEPWGNVCLEARATAKPIIASAVDGLSEQIQGCGVLVPPENPVALAKAIQELADLTSSELAQMGQQGRTSASNAWQTYLSNWQQLLEEIR